MNLCSRYRLLESDGFYFYTNNVLNLQLNGTKSQLFKTLCPILLSFENLKYNEKFSNIVQDTLV